MIHTGPPFGYDGPFSIYRREKATGSVEFQKKNKKDRRNKKWETVIYQMQWFL